MPAPTKFDACVVDNRSNNSNNQGVTTHMDGLYILVISRVALLKVAYDRSFGGLNGKGSCRSRIRQKIKV